MLHGWGFFPALDNIFTANTYIGNVGEEGETLLPMRGYSSP